MKQVRAEANLGLLVLATAICGCAQTVALVHPKRDVKLSLVEIAHRTPEWASIAQFDEATAMAVRSVSTIDHLNPAMTSGQAVGLTVSTVNAKKARLEASVLQAQAEKAISSVKARLKRDQLRLIATAKSQANRKIASGVEVARRDAIAQYEAVLPTLIDHDAAQRLGLQVQISALGVNADPKNPPTAPDDHWGKLLQQRKDELASLTAPQVQAEQSARQKITDAVALARTKLEAAANAELEAYEETLDARQKMIIARQTQAIATEQTELNAVSDELDQELSEPVVIPGSPFGDNGVLAGSVSGESLANVNESKSISPEVTEEAMSSRMAQRNRLVSVVLHETKMRAERAADGLGLKVVDWNAASPDSSAMQAVSSKLKSELAI